MFILCLSYILLVRLESLLIKKTKEKEKVCQEINFFVFLHNIIIYNDTIGIMKLTVITVCFNDLEGLKKTIPSVISQTFQDFEYIVIDGGSTDGSQKYIKSWSRINQWVSEKDSGIYNAMNKGVKMAHGEYCIFMNAGDHFFSVCSLQQIVPQLKGKDYYCGRAITMEENKAKLFIPPTEMTLYYQINDTLCHQSVFTKTDLLRNRPYSEELKIVSDWKQFFESWYLKKCSYESIQDIVSVFYLDGISSVRIDQLIAERQQTINQLLGNKKIAESKEQKAKRRKDKFMKDILSAMTQQPLARDWSIIRNGIKFFLKDLFN